MRNLCDSWGCHVASDLKIAEWLDLFATRGLIKKNLTVCAGLAEAVPLKLCVGAELSHISCFRCLLLTLLQLRQQGEHPFVRFSLHLYTFCSNISLLLPPNSTCVIDLFFFFLCFSFHSSPFNISCLTSPFYSSFRDRPVDCH